MSDRSQDNSAAMQVANVLREVTAAMQTAIAKRQRARMIDADDLIEILLEIADRLDPPI